MHFYYFYLELCKHSSNFFFIFPTASSSYRAGSTDITDPLSPLLPIVHRLR